MSIDKVLHKIQVQIKELAPTLELFVDPTIQPTVSDCEKLQCQLNHLQEQIAVYKHSKLNKELSPSFNLHAKVSEKEVVIEKAKEPEVTLKEESHKQEVEVELKELIVESLAEEPVFHHKSISVGINDKFRFINELFAQNAPEYSIAIEQLNTVRSWHDAETYLNSLGNLYEWNETHEIVKQFYSLVRKRFD